MKPIGVVLIVVGIILLVAAAAQHFMGLSVISHLAIYLAVAGILAILASLLVGRR